MAEHALCTLCSLETNSMIPDRMDIINDFSQPKCCDTLIGRVAD